MLVMNLKFEDSKLLTFSSKLGISYNLSLFSLFRKLKNSKN